MSKQPAWKYLQNLGDADPVNHGGLFVYVDETGVYDPQCEKLTPIGDGTEPDSWEVHRWTLEPCTWTPDPEIPGGGILSDNKFHPRTPAWFAKPFDPQRPQDGRGGLVELAEHCGATVEDLIAGFCSADPLVRAFAWDLVASYYCLANLDSYPLTLTRAEVEARYTSEIA